MLGNAMFMIVTLLGSIAGVFVMYFMLPKLMEEYEYKFEKDKEENKEKNQQ